MPSPARNAAIRSIGVRHDKRAAAQKAAAASPDKPSPPRPLTDIFADNVFNDTVQRERLPKPTYRALQKTRETGEILDLSIADAVANAMRDWAVERGATHFTHWFQPMTGLTAEKHDSFISLTGDDRIINEFSGRALVMGEPDASSFPSGGLRSTFEARGYTVWDPTSPAILRESPDGFTLLIPTTFCSWTGEALDKKTPLLRSDQAISKAAVRLVNLLGNDYITRVHSTIGCEQEYFLIDREFVQLRPDLICSGRTLFGARPPKGQELDDHYFGTISPRILGYMQEVELELWKLGIPITTRHNEVAPLQFEFAPIYRPSAVAIDQNMLTMEVLKKIADRHGFKCLLHEKPFAGVNGSGKHMNWSLEDNLGHNLLEPGSTPHDNAQFMMILAAIIRAIDLHGDLMRVAIAHAGNDHRLGANEAPPAIISIFLGSQLEGIVDALVDKRSPAAAGNSKELKLGLDSLPSIPRDITDRNRTSPFAFTGQKFEFRAVGSSQSAAYPATFLNTVVAESLNFLADELEGRKGRGDLREVVQELVTETLAKHRRVLFNGDNYAVEWEQEAERRDLPNLRDTPTALAQFSAKKNLDLFDDLGVLSNREALSRQKVLFDTYCSAIKIEAYSSHDLGLSSILPAAIRFQRELADSIIKVREACPALDLETEQAHLGDLTETISAFKRGLDDLKLRVTALDNADGADEDTAVTYRNEIIPSMDYVRSQGDRLEELVDDQIWPLPKYREMLFVH
ncbi:MAG: glutamine synthetase III [Planctomycetota bacterium]